MRSAHTLRRDWRFHAGYGLLTGEADVLVEAFAELAVHMEEIAGTHDLVLMDAHRRAVLLGPGLGPDRAGDDPFAPPGLVAEGAGGGGGIVYECRFAVEVDLFGVFLCGAEVGGEGEGDGGTTPGTKQKSGTMETTAYPLSRRAIFWTDMGAPGEDGGVWKGYLKNSR